MAVRILVNRGLEADIPTLAQGEPGWTTDTQKLYMGTGAGNVLINNGVTVTAVLIAVVWGTPGAESGDAIEISASLIDLDGNPFTSDIVEIEIRVTDAADDAEPSATAIIEEAGTPVGTLLAGDGTATVIMRTDASGNFAIKVTETAAAFRYLWIKGGGNARLWIRSSTGVLELEFV